MAGTVSSAGNTIAFDRLVRDVPVSGSRESFVLRFPWRTVILLTVLAAVARIIGLNAGLWIDEIYSLTDSFRPSLATVLTEYPGDTQHPLYSVLANLSHAIFGESPWSIRLPAVVFGVASVPALYALGERVAGAREGLLAAALLALSYHHVWFSQNARGYTMLAFWAILSSLWLYRGIREGGRLPFVLYGVAIGLGVYTHLTMVFTVAAQAMVAVGWTLFGRGGDRVRGRPSGAVLGLAVGVATGALLYAPVFLQVVDFFLNKPSQLEGVSTPSWALFETLRILLSGAAAWVGFLGGAILFGAGAWSYLRRDPLALALFVLPGVVTLVGALAARGTMYPRFYFAMIGFAFLIAVRGAFVVSGAAVRWVGGARVDQRSLGAGTLLAVLMVLVSAISLRGNYAAPKQDFAGALAWVDAEAGPGETVVTAGVPAGDAYLRYFEREFPAVLELTELEAVRERGRPVWVIYTFERYIEASDAGLMRTLRDDCDRSRTFWGTVGGGAVTVCRLPALGHGGRGQ